MPALALALLALAAAPGAAPREALLRASLDVTVVDLAFLDPATLAVLSEDALSLYALEGARFARVARLALPGEPVRARAAAGLLRLVPGEEACWTISSRRSGATLFTWSGRRLAASGGAEAIPPTALPPGAPPEGARFEPGTNRIALGARRVLRLVSSGLAVAPDGTLAAGGEPGTAGGRRVGDALADVGPDLVAASSPLPPGPQDEVQLLRVVDPTALPVASWSVPGRVRALAAWTAGPPLLAVASEAAGLSEIAVHALPEAGH